MRYHKRNKLLVVKVSEERDKGTESLFKEIMNKNCTIWGETWISMFMKLICHPKTSDQGTLK